MKTKAELLRRACLWVALVMGSVGLLLLPGARNSQLAYNLLPLYLLILPILLPGAGLAHALNLLGPGGWNPPPDPHPVAGQIVLFAASAIFWTALLWYIFIQVNAPLIRYAAPQTTSPNDPGHTADDNTATPSLP